MKNVVKFKFLEQEGFLSCVEENEMLYTLVKKDTPKVSSILTTHQMLISTELKIPEYIEKDVEVSFDQALIQSLYEKLEKANNLYFKTLDDTLCVLIIKM